jgi:hypothetical protein
MEAPIDFEYDKEYFIGLNKIRKLAFTKQLINDTVMRLHDPSLENRLDYNRGYYLYSDGSITKIKKENMYTTHDEYISYEIIKPSSFFTFPCKGQSTEDTFCIMTAENCNKVKDLIDELLLLI